MLSPGATVGVRVGGAVTKLWDVISGYTWSLEQEVSSSKSSPPSAQAGSKSNPEICQSDCNICLSWMYKKSISIFLLPLWLHCVSILEQHWGLPCTVIAIEIVIYVALRTLCLLSHWFQCVFNIRLYITVVYLSIIGPLFCTMITTVIKKNSLSWTISVSFLVLLWFPLWLQQLYTLEKQCVPLLFLVATVIQHPFSSVIDTMIPTSLSEVLLSMWLQHLSPLMHLKIIFSLSNTVFFPKHWFATLIPTFVGHWEALYPLWHSDCHCNSIIAVSWLEQQCVLP